VKKLAFLILLLSGLAALLLVVGCDKDDDTVTGSEDDPQFEAFDMFFAQVDEGTGHMVGMPLMFMDSIITEGGAQGKLRMSNTLNADTYTLTWHDASQYWYCTGEFTEDFTTISVIDSIQFRYASGPVKYPLDRESLTEIRSYLSLIATGTGIDTAYGFQNTTLTQNYTAGLLFLDGTGGSTASLIEDGCTISWDFDMTFNDITWYSDYMWDEEDELNCPTAGTITHTGTLEGECEGGTSVVSGSWGAEKTFNNGLVAWSVTTGNTVWSGTDTCDVGVTQELSAIDSLFVEDLFGGGATGLLIESFDVAFALLVDSGIMPPMDSPELKGRFGTALSDTTIILGSSYTYTNGWHVFTFEAQVQSLSDTLNVAGIDSIKALIGSTPQQTFDHPFVLDALYNHAHLNISATGAEGVISAGQHHVVEATMDVSELDTAIVFSGTAHDTVDVFSSVGEGTCEIGMTLDQTVTGWTFNPETENECPSAGSVITTFSIDIDCSSPTGSINEFGIEGGWTVTAVANGDNTVTVTFDNGIVQWSVTDDCVDLSSIH